MRNFHIRYTEYLLITNHYVSLTKKLYIDSKFKATGICMAKSRNYINNKELYTSLVSYQNKLERAKKANEELPRVPNYIGESLLMICNNLAKKPNFSSYTEQWKQEMKSDAIYDCLSAVNNFDPNKTNNPFAYFTQIAWNAFIRRIHKEKKQIYIKHKNYENMYLMDSYTGGIFLDLKTNEYSSDVVKNFEDRLIKIQKQSKVAKGVDKFIEDIPSSEPGYSDRDPERNEDEK